MKTIVNDDFSVIYDNWSKDVMQEVDKALKKSIRTVTKELKEQTISNAKAGIKTYNNHAFNGENYEDENILDAVRITKMQQRYDEDDIYQKVHVMGTGRKNSKTFRFRFLEKGTKERSYIDKNGKEHRLGRIVGRRFFKKAKQQITDPLPIFEENISEVVQKINNE